MKEILENKYGKEEAAKRIYATTDKAKGALKSLATEEGYETFVVPDDVGGRFSVLTAVGLLPIAASGADITKLMEGAQSMRKLCLETPIEKNDAILYAAVRNLLYRKGKSVEVLANYEPIFHYVGEWWKQLYGESEGKDQKGIFPASVDLTTDLHSMGQFIQDGSRIMYETVMELEKPALDLTVKKEENDLDGLNYLAGKTLDFVNSQLRGCQPGPRGRHRQDRRGAAHQADDHGPDGERGGGADRQRFSEINGPRERGRRRPLFLFPPGCGTIPEKSFVKGGGP